MSVETIGKRIARLRDGLGISQSELARRASVSHAFISKLEADVYDDAKSNTLAAIAAGLGVSLDYLRTGDPDEDDAALLDNAELRDLLRDILATLPSPEARHRFIEIAKAHLAVERQLEAEAKRPRPAANG